MATATMPGVQTAQDPTLPAENRHEGEVVPVELYLRTSYRPDREFLNGHLLERHVGELPHGRVQGFFVKLFGRREEDWRLEAVVEQRVQVSANRFRIPDVCVLPLGSPDTLIVHQPPLLCIEVLSREDGMSEMQARVDDYLAMGVMHVWIIDPWRRMAFVAQQPGELKRAAEQLSLEGTAVVVPLEAIFNELNRYQGYTTTTQAAE